MKTKKQQILEKRIKNKNRNNQKAQGKSDDVNPLVNKIVRGVGSVIGGLVDPLGGSLIGDNLADSAHRYFKKITGVGDYKVDKNSIMTDSVPTFAKDSRAIRVAHREYFTDLVPTSTSFQCNQYYINPGNRRMFPWLYWLAQSYEQYRFHGLVFEFKTTSATAIGSTNTALGTVILATQYNALDKSFQSKYEMENYQFAVSTVPSMSVIHPIECNMKESPMDNLYIRDASKQSYGQQNGWDARMYDIGILNIATVGQQAVANLGEIWVSYDIELLKPKCQKNFVGISHYQSSTTTDGAPLKDMVEQQGGMLGQFVTLSDTAIVFDPVFYGTVFVSYDAKLSGGAVSANYTITPSGNASAANILSLDNLSNEVSGTSGTAYLQTSSFLIAGGGTLTFASGVLGTRTAVDLIIASSGSQ